MDIDKFTSNVDQPRLLVVSGAGLSRPSGVPTFRDSPDGLWNNHRLEVVCWAENFDQYYDTVHEFYSDRRKDLARVSPNAAHEFLNEMEFLLGDDRFLHMTANVDDLVERHGGTAMHLHGYLPEIVTDWKTNPKVVDIGYTEYKPAPGSVDRPNVVMFGDYYRYENGLKKPVYGDRNHVLGWMNSDDIIIVIGSSDTVIEWSVLAGWGTPSRVMNVNPIKHDRDHAFNQNVYKGVVEAIPEMRAFIEEHLGV